MTLYAPSLSGEGRTLFEYDVQHKRRLVLTGAHQSNEPTCGIVIQVGGGMS